MKRCLCVCVGFGIMMGLAASRLAAEEDVGALADSSGGIRFSGVGLAVVGEMDEAAVERVREFAERNTGIPVRLREVPTVTAASLGEVADALTAERIEEDAAFVLLYAGDADFPAHTVYRYDRRTGIVNVSLLQTDDEEMFLRRIEKLTMRSLGLLMNVPPVPNPQSAMWNYSSLEELDLMGRNFDPPSLRVIQLNAQEMGIELISDSPFLMIR